MPNTEKRMPIVQDKPRYKKKSKYKGKPRSKHKHDYKIVILHTYNKLYTGSERTREYVNIAKVCEICGRIKDMNWNEKSEYCYSRQLFSDSLIEEKTKYLEHWYSNFFDNTAYKSKINHLHLKNKFKLEPIPSFPYMPVNIAYEP